MTVSIEIIGIKKTNKFLKSKNKETIKLVTKALNRGGIFLQGEVKMSIAGNRAEHKSVDTGRFLNSIDLQTTKNSTIVFTGIPYAKKLEFGTSKFAARKHFNNSANRNKNKIIEIINKSLKKL